MRNQGVCGSRDWTIRRRIIYATLGFCAGYSIYALVWTVSDARAEAAILQSFLLAGAVVASYVFGAIWDDKNKLRAPWDGAERRASLPIVSV